jgi:GNAT superfamily N-acetyltransferase
MYLSLLPAADLDAGQPSSALPMRQARPADAEACGRICYTAFADIAARHGFPPDFASVDAATLLLSDLIDHPGFYALVAESAGQIVASAFLDERSPIVGVGHVTVDPATQDRGVGRALMAALLQRCAHRGVPGIRLQQASYHHRSMSLYAKLGFDLREPFAVMQGAPLAPAPSAYCVRTATIADLSACDALCKRVHGHDRSGALRDAVTATTAQVVERDSRITGYTTGIGFHSHTVAETNDDLQALIGAAERFDGPGFLVPMRNTELLRWCLANGLRVTVVLNLMTIGLYSEPRGAYLASAWY